MKLAFTALCAVAACLLAPTGTMFNGGPAPNKLVIEEEKVVRDVALSPFYTSFLCVEEQSAIIATFALDHRDTADPFKSVVAAQPDTVYRVTGLEGHLAKASTHAVIGTKSELSAGFAPDSVNMKLQPKLDM